MMRNRLMIGFAVAAMWMCCALQVDGAPRNYELASPAGVLTVTLSVDDSLHYSVSRGDVPVVDRVTVGMNLGGVPHGVKPQVKKVKRTSADETIKPVVAFKHSEIRNCYNALTVMMKDGFGIELRAFDNGVAHRVITDGGTGRAKVYGETYSVKFSANSDVVLQQPGGFKTSYEEPYTRKRLSEWTVDDRMSVLPVLVERPDSLCVLVSESDLYDYPCMFLKGTGATGFTAIFPRVPVHFGSDGDRSVKILEEADYIAETSASRTFPWRYMAIGSPNDIVEQTLTCQLASPAAIDDTSWIRPGQVSWEWWNGATPYGEDVDFEAGCNQETYKYYIDFASKYGIPYILLDEGWAKDTRDPYTANDRIDLLKLVEYGKKKNVGIFLWLTWLSVENNPGLLGRYKEWGIDGVKVDFMDRSDQWMVNFYERVCAEAAKHGIMVDMHGSFKPAGLEYRYPNLMSYEGVRGMEQGGYCQPDNSLYLPFIRNAVGPMDYTPGAMISMQPDCYQAARPNAASIGTRAYQLALYVVFDSGVQMLADNPTLYYRNPDCTEFITSVPVTWDETMALEAAPGEYVAIARRKADQWYIGAIANSKVRDREFSLPLDFLAGGQKYSMVSFSDGVNANRQAMDYRRNVSIVVAGDTLELKLARSGGFAAILTPVSDSAASGKR